MEETRLDDEHTAMPLDEQESPSATLRTDNPDVDAALAVLEDLQDRPVAEHVAVFETAHRALRAALSGSDAGD